MSLLSSQHTVQNFPGQTIFHAFFKSFYTKSQLSIQGGFQKKSSRKTSSCPQHIFDTLQGGRVLYAMYISYGHKK